jgi:hypothetical protein
VSTRHKRVVLWVLLLFCFNCEAVTVTFPVHDTVVLLLSYERTQPHSHKHVLLLMLLFCCNYGAVTACQRALFLMHDTVH